MKYSKTSARSAGQGSLCVWGGRGEGNKSDFGTHVLTSHIGTLSPSFHLNLLPALKEQNTFLISPKLEIREVKQLA